MLEIPKVIRDEEYYFSSADDLLIFQVESRLFRVHRFFLERESPVFRDMLSLPQTSADNREDITEHEGGSDARPIHIPGLTSGEFRILLEMLYKPPCIYPEFSQEQWLMLMSVARRFQVCVNYAHVMKMLDTSTPRLDEIAQVKLAEDYGMPMSCIRPALVRLTMRLRGFELKEMEGISVRTIVLLFNAREKYLSRRVSITGGNRPWDLESDGVRVVKELFEAESVN